MRTITWIAFLGILAVAAPAWAATAVKHSGDLVAVDPARHTITLDEMGPWHGAGTKPSRHVVRFAAGAKIDLVARGKNGPDGWAGGYVERPMQVGDLHPGDWVVLTMEREGKRTVAVGIDVVRP
ncbi:MAG TPA: hypothetical protein VEH80_02465 [Candidatus Bathyarchaeia archaeon]|nr:hypothetical protein [Candidatus Bathyarchaeia archaeon]